MASQIYYQEQSSTHPCPLSTRPVQFSHGVGEDGRRRRDGISSSPKVRLRRFTSTGQIRAIAARKFAEKETFGEGITYRDLCKGKYKVVETEQQARELLHYHKKKGTLFSNKPIMSPQRYYASQDQAETGARIQQYRNRTKISDPTEGSTFKRHLAPPKTSITAPPTRPRTTEQDIDNLKARNFSEAMDYYHKLIAGSLSEEEAASIKVGAHKILIHLQVYPGREEEAYQERLYDVAPSPKNNRAKALETHLEISANIYHVKASVFPSGRIIIDVPCSDKPFPIWLQDPHTTNKDFLILLTNIRYFLKDKMRDAHDHIIPPTHNPCWRLKNCDINFDIPTTAINLFAFPDMQVKQFYNVAVSRIYAKMLGSTPYIRVEKACKHFDMPITDNIGQTLVEEAREVKCRDSRHRPPSRGL
jgi:hypothetical protein